MNRKPGPQNPKKRAGNLEKKKRLREILDQELISGVNLYRFIVENSHFGIFVIDDNFEVVYANNEMVNIVGYGLSEIVGSDFRDYLTQESRDVVAERYMRRQAGDILPRRYEVEFYRKDSELRTVEICVSVNKNLDDVVLTVVQVFDITDRKRIAAELKASGERDLLKIQKVLEEKVTERTQSLEESNVALEVLLKKRENDRREVEEQVMLNIRESIFPYIERLKASPLRERQKIYLEIIERNLKEIAAPFMRGLSDTFQRLTPSEIQVINLIKQNKTTKVIADFLGVSPRTIESHRDNIRKKLGIANQKINLRSYLLAIR